MDALIILIAILKFSATGVLVRTKDFYFYNRRTSDIWVSNGLKLFAEVKFMPHHHITPQARRIN